MSGSLLTVPLSSGNPVPSSLSPPSSFTWFWKQRNTSISLEAETSNLPTTSTTIPPVDIEGCDLQEGTKEIWRPVGKGIPSNIHPELVRTGVIPDPNLGFNEHEIQWVGEVEWLYACVFEVGQVEKEKEGGGWEAVFEGLDTHCTVFLNGEKILEADNMFRAWRAKLPQSLLLAGDDAKPNTLLLRFPPTYFVGKQLEQEHGEKVSGSHNIGSGDRVYVRKAQYQYKWDWGIRAITCGPHLPIRLEHCSTRLADLQVRTSLVDPKSLVSVDVSLLPFNTSAPISSATEVRATLLSPGGKELRSKVVKWADAISTTKDGEVKGERKTLIEWELEGKEVERWWCNGMGDQPLYEAQLELIDAEGKTSTQHIFTKFGLRTIELVQQPLLDAPGLSFFFKVNGVPVFTVGSNHIPADCFLPTVSVARYRTLLQQAKDGGHTMVRVWGGGVYETDAFYDLCDEMGLMVWQDFMFACGQYPFYEDFMDNVKQEVEFNVKRLRNHPSMALWCGNNEDYLMLDRYGVKPEEFCFSIYEDLLPSTVKTFTQDSTAYIIGSPFGGDGGEDATFGDIHQWNIWHGTCEPIKDWARLGGRFVSEFGFGGFPSIRTVDAWIAGSSDEEDREPQGRMTEQHQKHSAGERRFAVYLTENFKMTPKSFQMENYVYLTQLLQSEALSCAYRVWRREWKGEGREYNGGCLVWQLADSWPTISWAITDYYLRPKPSYFTIARECRPTTVGIERVVTSTPTSPLSYLTTTTVTLEIWATNSSLDRRVVSLELRAWDLETGKEEPSWEVVQEGLVLASNSSTEIAALPWPEPGSNGRNALDWSKKQVVQARIVDPKTKEIIARFASWPEPFKFYTLPNPSLVLETSTSSVLVSVKAPAKGVVLDVEGDDGDAGRNPDGSGEGWVRFKDQALDVFPGDPQTVEIEMLGGRKVVFMHLGLA